MFSQLVKPDCSLPHWQYRMCKWKPATDTNCSSFAKNVSNSPLFPLLLSPKMCSIYKSKSGVTKTWEKQGSWQLFNKVNRPRENYLLWPEHSGARGAGCNCNDRLQVGASCRNQALLHFHLLFLAIPFHSFILVCAKTDLISSPVQCRRRAF